MVKLREEDIERPEHLVEFNSEDVKSIAEALRKPGGLMLSGGTYDASIASAHVVRIGSRSLTSLEESMQIVRCYEIVNHKPTASQLRYDPVVKNFKFEFDDLKDRKKKKVSTPKISLKLDVVHCTEIFIDLRSMSVGDVNASLAHVV